MLLRQVGSNGISVLRRAGRAQLFLLQVLAGIATTFKRPKLLLQQVYALGVLSLPITLLTGFLVGMVLALQVYYTLTNFAAVNSLGVVSALVLLRELGPVLTALLFVARAGSALSAELGLMKTGEQLYAMQMMAVNPLHRTVGPRLVAGFLAVPALTAMFMCSAVMGAHFVAVGLLTLDAGIFWSQMQATVSFVDDVMNGLLKALVFGFVVTWIAVFEGYDAAPSPEGVSQATTRAVVNASVAVLALDFILTAIMFGGR